METDKGIIIERNGTRYKVDDDERYKISFVHGGDPDIDDSEERNPVRAVGICGFVSVQRIPCDNNNEPTNDGGIIVYGGKRYGIKDKEFKEWFLKRISDADMNLSKVLKVVT